MSDPKKPTTSKPAEVLEGGDSSSSDEEIVIPGTTIPGEAATTKGDGMKYSCDIIRRNVNMFLATMEMTQAKFLEALGGISEEDFAAFMAVRGREKGKENPFYLVAHTFFEEREKQEREERKAILSNQASKSSRKRKSEVLDPETLTTAEIEQNHIASAHAAAKAIATATAPSASTSVPSSKKGGWVKPEIDVLIEQVHKVELPDNDKVYDDCDEIRRKISVFVEEEAFSITKFAFAIRTTPSVVNRFLSRKGKDQGKPKVLTIAVIFLSFLFHIRCWF